MDCPACHTPNAEGARFCAKCGALLPATSGPDADPLIGTVIQRRFRITGVLGEGGMGRVYKGEQQMGTAVRKVAIKTLLSQYAKDTQVVARFMRECGTVSELEHPNTIKFYDFGQTNTGDLYIAMELLSGVSLERALETGALAPERVDRIVQQICGSLTEAHEKGIVHRDLKPANIYLTVRAGEEDYVKVLDFGIAKRDDEQSKQEQKLTQQGTVLGTPPYMSPEQFKGHQLDARSDIYSLGVMTYEMLTGRLPFDADTPWAWATQHMTAQPFPFETIPLGSQVPPKMKAAVMRALSKDRERRQQTAREFFEELTLTPTRTSSQIMSAPMTRPDVGLGGTALLAPSQNPPQPISGSMSALPPSYEPSVSSYNGPTTHDPTSSSHGYQPPPPVYTQQQRSVPTGSGQVFAPPPSPAPQRGGAGGIIAGVLIGLVSLCVGGVLLFRANVFGGETRAGGAGSNTSATAPPVPPPPTREPVAPPTHAPPTPPPPVEPPPPATTEVVGKTADECKLGTAAANKSEIPKAATHFLKCEGAEKARLKTLIENQAVREARAGCSHQSMAAARAAKGIGIDRPMEVLKAARCRPGKDPGMGSLH